MYTKTKQVMLSEQELSKPIKSSVLLHDTSLTKALRSVIGRACHLIEFSIRRKSGRYLQLSPSVCSRQILLDRKCKRLLRFDLYNKSDFYTIEQIYLGEGYALDKLRRYNDLISYYDNIIQAGKTPFIIDCGGNIGIASRYFSENYPESKIICIEPCPESVTQAKNNNKSTNIIFKQCAIGSEKCRGTIVDPGLGSIGYRMTCADNGTTEIVTVNEILEQYCADDCVPFLIKIDIEGFESDLFSKNYQWIEKFPLMIIELHDWMLPKNNNARNFLNAIAPLNRDFVFRGEDIFSISNTLV